jgi:transcriptional regulator with XRE-family HTH domain
MDMNVNAKRIRQLREERAWSQEHLAAAAGLGVRTIQRIEAEGNASAESRMAIAAALDVELAVLNAVEEPDAAFAPQAAPAAVTLVAAVPDRRFLLSWQQYRFLMFLLVASFLLALDLSHNHAVTWSRWPVAAGGGMLLLRWFRRRYVEPSPWRRC